MAEKLHRVGEHGIPHCFCDGHLDLFLADDLVQQQQGLRPASHGAFRFAAFAGKKASGKSGRRPYGMVTKGRSVIHG